MQEAIKERISQKYEFIRDLGSDWVGEVYEAKRHLGGGRVVIKTLHQRTAENHQLANKIYKSIKKVRPIVHPNIAKIIEVEKTDDNQIFFVREFFKGETLRSLINRKGKIPVEKAVNISIQILSALSAIHKRGFIHGCLSPSNIYLYEEKDENIFVKLIDYSMFDVQDVVLEFDDMIKNYMSPEQAIGDSAGDEQTDVFAVGAILYELLSGQRAYETKEDEDVTLQIALHSPVPLRSIAGDIPSKLLKEIEKAMDSEREKRHRNVVEFIKMLLPFAPNIAKNSSPSSLSALKRLLPGERTLVGDNSAISKEKGTVRENTELYNSKERIEIRPSIAPVKPSSQTKLHFQKTKQKGQKLENKQITSESLKKPVLETKLIKIAATEPSVFSEQALESLNPPFAKIEESKKEQISKSIETEEKGFPQKENISLENISEEKRRTSSDHLTQIEEEEIDSNIFLEETEEDSNILPLSYLEKDKTESIHTEYKKNKILIRINEYTSLWGTKAKQYFAIVSSLLLKNANNLKPFLVENKEKVITFAKKKKPALVKLAKSSVATKKRQYITATSLVLLAMLIVVLIVAGSNGDDTKAMANEKSSQASIEKKQEKPKSRQIEKEAKLSRIEEKASLENKKDEKTAVNEIEATIENEETDELEEIEISNKKEKPLPKKRRFFQKRKRKFKKVKKSPVNKNWATNPFERH